MKSDRKTSNRRLLVVPSEEEFAMESPVAPRFKADVDVQPLVVLLAASRELWDAFDLLQDPLQPQVDLDVPRTPRVFTDSSLP